MMGGSSGVGVHQLDVSDPPDGAGLAKRKSHMLGGDHGEAARVVGRHADQGAAVIREHGVRVHVAISENERQYPTMLGPTHGPSRGSAVRAEGAAGDVQGPIAAQRWIYLLSLSRLG